jgi:diacylglycerol kinase family enzyme
MRITLIHNPRAGYHGITAHQVILLLQQSGYQPTCVSSRGPEMEKALESPGELVVIAGGDGTVARVAIHLAGRSVPAAIIPLGTANNIATALGIAGTIEVQVGSWARARPRKIDIGVARGRWGEIRFIESFGVGLMAMTMRNIEPMHASSQQKFQTRDEEFRQAYREMKKVVERTAPRHCAIESDGVDRSGSYVLAEALNIPCIGPKLPLAPQADAGDGQLDVVLVGEDQRERFCQFLTQRIQDDPIAPDLFVQRATRVMIDPRGTSMHIDDVLHSESHEPLEPAGPIELTVDRQCATFLTP